MNIGLVIPGFSANEHDWCIPVYLNYVKHLAQEHEVRVFPIRYPYTQTPYMVHNARIFPIGGGSYTHGMQRWWMLHRLQQRIKYQHAQKPFDILHAIWADETGAATNWVGRALDIPSVVSIAGGELVSFPDIGYGLQGGRVSRYLVKEALLKASAIVAPSEYSQKMVLNFISIEKRVHLVPLGVDTSLFKPSSLSELRPREYIHVGSLIPIKQQSQLLHLMATLPNATLDIVGDGPLRSELEGLARHLGINERVVFQGAIPHDELPQYYQQAQFLLMTSRHEAFCMAAIEALACGTGVIGTPVGILPEVGITPTQATIHDLQRAILNRPRKHGKWQPTRYRLLAETVYSIEKMVQNLVKVYETTMEHYSREK